MAINYVKPNMILTSDVRPLDILLMRGRGQISEMTSWSHDSFYSHVSIALNKISTLEGSLLGTRTVPLAERIELPDILFIDVYRFVPIARTDGRVLNSLSRKLILDVAGTYFPRKGAAWICFISAWRNYIPVSCRIRAKIRPALDALLPARSRKLNCIDVFAECTFKLFKRFGSMNVILNRPVLRRSLPRIAVIKLLSEANGAYRVAKLVKEKKNVERVTFEPGKEADFLGLLDQARYHRQIKLKNDIGTPWTLRRSAIMLSDIETSPSFRLVGRLKSTNLNSSIA